MNVPATKPPEPMREASAEDLGRSEALLNILKSYPPPVAIDMLVFACTQLIMSMVPNDGSKPIDRLHVWARVSDAVHDSIEINEERRAREAGPP